MVGKQSALETVGRLARQLFDLSNGAKNGHDMAVVGLRGGGRRQVLDSLFTTVRDRQGYFSAETIPTTCLVVDMQNLVEPTWCAIYHLVLRTLHEQTNLLDKQLVPIVHAASRRGLASSDTFFVQSELRSILRHADSIGIHLILILDQLDTACGDAASNIVEALDSLRSGVSESLSYVFGVSADLFHSATPNMMTNLQRRLNVHALWIAGMDPAETERELEELLHGKATGRQLASLAKMSGGFPSLIQAVANWWLSEWHSAESLPELEEAYRHHEVQAALMVLWDGLYFYERSILHEFTRLKARQHAAFIKRHRSVLQSLVRRGVLVDTVSELKLFSPFMQLWLKDMRHTIRGHVWFNDTNDTYYQGDRPLESLSPRAEAALEFFLQHPQKKCDKDLLIAHIWETPYVTDDSVYQVIRELRRQLEPDSRRPCYLLNHRGLRGGRYQFFPNGHTAYRPGNAMHFRPTY